MWYALPVPLFMTDSALLVSLPRKDPLESPQSESLSTSPPSRPEQLGRFHAYMYPDRAVLL
ncbi:hypothetical protein SNARM312S_05260 [Streptomyces narbonensis]